jgi:hypothetical protein
MSSKFGRFAVVSAIAMSSLCSSMNSFASNDAPVKLEQANVSGSADKNISDVSVPGSVKMFDFKQGKYVYVLEPLSLSRTDGESFIPNLPEAKDLYAKSVDGGKKPIIAVLDTYKTVMDGLKKKSADLKANK